MNLMHARGLWLLLGVLPIVLLYILKARRRRVRVPSNWLWLSAQRDLQARSPFRKLKRELPLFLEILALALLALGLGQPACRGRSIPGSHVAVVLDVSASMATIDDRTHRARMDEARQMARRLVDGLAIGSDAMLVVSGRDARVAFALGRDRNALRRAIDGTSPQDVEGDVTSAVSLALDRLRPLGGDRRVLIVTDGASGRTESIPSGPIPIQVLRVGHPQDNLGVIRMDVRTARQGRQPETVQVFALLANHGLQARDAYVTVRREGESDVVASRRLRLDPGAREPVVLSFPLGPEDVGRGVVLDLDPHDALATDDVAYGRIPPGARLPVALVMRGESPWVQRALESDPDVVLTQLTADRLENAPPGALIVLHGACPDPLPPVHDVVVFAPPVGRCADVTVDAPVENPIITSYLHTDARFRFLTMDGVHLADATPLRLGTHASEILHAGDHAIFADVSTPEREVTIVGLDPADSDWPLRASFVLFIRNLEEIARAHRARAVMGGGRTGEPLRIAVPPRVTRVDVTGPAGVEHVGVTAGSAVVGETTKAGLYHLRWQGGDTIAPVNLLSDGESNLRVPPLHVQGAQPTTDLRALVRPHEELTPWIALAAALILSLNLFWITRRERTPVAPARGVRPLEDPR